MRSMKSYLLACMFISAFGFVSMLAHGQSDLSDNLQKGSSFSNYITFNGEQTLIAYYVPGTYDSLVPNKMILALHYCGGNGQADAITYRNLLTDLADMIEAVVVAPYCNNNGAPYYNIPDPSILNVSIDSTLEFLNIDTNSIYLTGGSCNGRSTFEFGLTEIYDFIGIIPFNAWIPNIVTGYYNFDSEMPSCICSGTLDPSYLNNTRMYDSLVAHQAITKMNSMPGIGHIFNFPEFTDEMKECIDFIDSVSTPPVHLSNNLELEETVQIFPNPFKNTLNIKLTSPAQYAVKVELIDPIGRGNELLFLGNIEKGKNSIRMSVIPKSYEGLYFIKISSSEWIISRKVLFHK